MSAKVLVHEEYLYPDPSDRSRAVLVGSEAWFEWLCQHDRFVFQNSGQRYTARRELRRGKAYWYGYRKVDNKLRKAYLGKSSSLTLDTLIVANSKLAKPVESRKLSQHVSLPKLEPSLISTGVDPVLLHGEAAVGIPFTLITRLIPPTLPANLITRRRLIEQIESPITLVTAPSGFGKTTLLRQWLERSNSSAAWISLDASEDNTYAFWMTVTAALQQIDPLIGDTVSILLQSASFHPVTQILAGLIHNLSRWHDAHPERKLALVIDNYQRVRSPDIDASCQFFLDHLPPACQVIMTSQVQFPFAVQRWRAKGVLTELVTDDLRFTPEEGVAWLEQAITVPLAAREKLSLALRAGGWGAGLNLLALALKREDDVHRFIATFDGHHPILQAYFVEEILRKLPADQQTFLLQTSILKYLNGPLCDVVTQRRGSQGILQDLHRSNQFISLVDEAQGWYQYHELFAQALWHLLKEQQPRLIPSLHRRAAAWYQENEHYSEVIRHLLRIEAWSELGQFIDQVVIDELRRGSDDRVLRWIQQLPDELFLQHDSFLVTYARLAMSSLPRGQVEDLLNRISSRIENIPADDRTPSQQKLLTRYSEWEHVVASGMAPRPLAPAATELEYVGYLFDLNHHAHYLNRLGETEASEGYFAEAIEEGRAQGIVFAVLSSGGAMVNLIATQGRLREAETKIRDILQYALDQAGSLASCASIAMTVLGKIYYTRNQIAQAKQFIDDAVMIDPNPTSLNMVINHHGLLAQILNAKGDRQGAQATIRAALELEPFASNSVTIQDLKVNQALLYIRDGLLIEAEQLLLQISSFPIPVHHSRNGLLKAVWAELFLGQLNFEEAEAVLAGLERCSIHWYTFNVVPYVNLLLALAYWGQKKFADAQREMNQAIRIAEAEGIIRPFLDCGRQIIPLLTATMHEKRVGRNHRLFVRQLRDQFFAENPHLLDTAEEPTSHSMVDKLSPREREVLQLLADGLNNTAMARRLSIADSTVSTHLRNIYRKLKVSSRMQAARKARELGLL